MKTKSAPALELTLSAIKDLQPDPTRDLFIRSISHKGLSFKLSKNGHKSFIFTYSISGKRRVLSIGEMSQALTLHQAKEIAKGLAGQVAQGIDPLREKQKIAAEDNLDALFERYAISPKFKSNAELTQTSDLRRYAVHIQPLLGKMPVSMITKTNIEKMRDDITNGKTAVRKKTGVLRGMTKARGGAGVARQCVVMITTLFNWAIENNFIDKSNPAEHVEYDPIAVRDVNLTIGEYQALNAAINEMADKLLISANVADAVKLIMVTGARRGEITKLKWRNVDFENQTFTYSMREHKTGRKTKSGKTIHIPDMAWSLITNRVAGKPDELVFPSDRGEVPIALSQQFTKIRAYAGLPQEVTLHGLRHAVAGALAMSGASVVEVATLLGHKQTSTAERYIKMADEAKRSIAARAGNLIGDMLSKGSS